MGDVYYNDMVSKIRKYAPELLALSEEELRTALRATMEDERHALYRSADQKYIVYLEPTIEGKEGHYINGVKQSWVKTGERILLTLQKRNLVQGGYVVSYHILVGVRFDNLSEVLTLFSKARGDVHG